MSYDAIAGIYDADMGASMQLDDLGCYVGEARRHGGRVVELGCGSGRVLRGLLAAGIDAVGIDRSLPMLRQARRALGEAPPLLQMDLQALGLRRVFDLALLPYSLITYVLDEAGWQALADGLRAALRPGGRVVLDAFVPQPGLAGAGWMRDYARRQAQGWLVRHKRIETLPEGLRRIQRRYRLRGAFAGRSLCTEERIRPYAPAELEALARCHLGEPVARYWDYTSADEQQGARFCTLVIALRDAPPSAELAR